MNRINFHLSGSLVGVKIMPFQLCHRCNGSDVRTLSAEYLKTVKHGVVITINVPNQEKEGILVYIVHCIKNIIIEDIKWFI